MATTKLSKVTPDFELLYNELVRKLETKQTWIDLLPTGVGTTVSDMFAGSHVSNQLYLDIAFREAFLPMAVRDSSIFSGTRMLGVDISRKTPASVTASLSNFGTVTKYVIPYTQFELDGVNFFNRTQYVIPPGQTINNLQLYQGTVKNKSIDLSAFPSLALREFNIGEPGFIVSSADILVYTETVATGDTQVWNKTDKAIFEHTSDDYVYFASTLKDGDVSLFFGDGKYGVELSSGDVLKIRYAVTEGAAGNSGLPGIDVTIPSESVLSGLTLTAIAGGADEKSALYYKRFASNMFRTKRRAISGSDIRAILMDYPGIADVTVLGQRDIAPNDLRFLNTIRICALPEETDTFGGSNPNPNSSAWTAIEKFLQPLLHKAYTIQHWNPVKKFVKVRVKLALLPSAQEGQIKIVAMEEILKLFLKRPGILGRRLSESDITGALKRIEGIDYVEVMSPIEEIIPSDKTEYVVLDGNPIIETVYSERALST